MYVLKRRFLKVFPYTYSGLLIHPEGPLNPDLDPSNISEMFRPFQTLLQKIRYIYTFNESYIYSTLNSASYCVFSKFSISIVSVAIEI